MSGWRAGLVAALVGGAVLLAGWLIPRLGSDGDGGGDASTTPTTTAGSALPPLACAAELDTVCRSLAGTLGTTVRRFTPGIDPGGDVVILAPTPDLPDGFGDAAAVGRSPIVITAWRERAQVLGAHCGGPVDTGCLERAYGNEWSALGGNAVWGIFKAGLADPGRSEAAMLAWSLVAGGGVADGLEESLRLRAADTGALMEEMVLFGDSRADAAVAPEVAVAAQLANAIGRGGRLEVFYPSSGPWVEYAAAGRGRDAGRLVERLLESGVQQALGPLGLRPAVGEAAGLPDGLGTPGTPAPGPDEAARTALLGAWEGLR
jgi:hypothetical protein